MSVVDHLASYLFPRSDKDKYMLFLSAYFDETGSEPDPNVKICGFGGCVATSQEWNTLEDKWQTILDDYGVKHFHSTDFFNFRGQFENGWKEDLQKCQKFYRRLWNVILEVKPTPFGCLIPLDDYRGKLDKQQRKELVDAYFLTYQTVMAMTIQILCVPENFIEITRLATIFDDKKGFKKPINDFYEIVLKDAPQIRGKMPSPVFDSWRDVIPLQVADIIAYESHREYRRRLYYPESNKKYGFQRLEMLNRLIGGNFFALGSEESRIIFRPPEYIDSLVESFNQTYEDFG